MPLDARRPTSIRERYAVTFTYREPTFELWHGARENPFRFSIDIVAQSRDDALHLAREEFQSLARESSVAWIRQVLQTDVACLGPERRAARPTRLLTPAAERRRGQA